MSDDLVKRLLGTPLYEGSGEESDLPDQAAARIEAMTAERDALREAGDRLADRAQHAFAERHHQQSHIIGAKATYEADKAVLAAYRNARKATT